MKIGKIFQTFFLMIVFVFGTTLSACTPGALVMTGEGELKQFSSLDEIDAFLSSSSSSGGYYGGARLGGVMMESATMDGMAMDNSAMPLATKSFSEDSGSSGGYATDSSETNVQVKGVDEADIVKNDGKYIYYVANNKLFIIDAYPADDAEVISEIEIEDGYIQEIFINEDKLVVMGHETFRFDNDDSVVSGAIAKVASIMPRIPMRSHSFIKIYDVSDRAEPEMEESISLEGNYLDSRMIDDYAYVIINKYAYAPFKPPMIYSVDGVKEIKAQDIAYFDMPDYSYQLSIIIAVDLENNEFSEKTFLKGSSQNVFVSKDNIYLSSQRQIPYYYEQMMIFEEVLRGELSLEVLTKIEKIEEYDLRESTKFSEIEYLVGQYFESLDKDELEKLQERLEPKIEKIQDKVQKMRDQSIIHKISIDEMEIEYKSSGNVPGRILNQFSMDEYDENLRVATTVGNSWDEKNPSSNNIYVLDEDLEIIGELEDLAPKERIYSARFIGDRAYMVTFRNIDPLFVIDLSDAENPEVLGKLKIPGYSDYLHPYDEDHIIGFGKETNVPKDEDDRTIPQGFKMSLFDVSDVENPKEVDKVVIGDRGSSSDILWDHKALLFSKEKNLLVLPVKVAEINPEQYEDEEVPQWAYGDTVFQGAYVYDISIEDGFKLQGEISHIDEDVYQKSGYYFYSESAIQRTLYMDDTLYTLSRTNVQAHDLNDLDDELIDIVIKEEEDEKDYPVYYEDDVVIMRDSEEVAVGSATVDAIEIEE